MTRMFRMRLAAAGVIAIALAVPSTSAWAHARPQTSSPQPGQRLDEAPTQIAITYDDSIDPSNSPLLLFDSTGAPVATVAGPVSGTRQMSISPVDPLPPGPYTVGWNSLDTTDGHDAHGFYTFVVNGGPVGIIGGVAQAQAAAADLTATLTVAAGPDGASVLRVDLDQPAGVERVRIRLSRPDLGEDLLDTHTSGDGGWVLDSNEVALPGEWHAEVIVRRTNIFDDAHATFDFNIDPAAGTPSFG